MNKYINIAKIVILAAIIAFGSISYNSYKKASRELDRVSNQVAHYQDLYMNSNAEKAVLEISGAALKYTNDRLAHKLDSIAKKRGIDISRSGSVAASISTVLNTRDSVVLDTVKLNETCDFKVSIKPNDQTVYNIELKKDTLIHEAIINNKQLLYVYPKREFKNKYNTFIRRLLRFDFKKVDMTRYYIENSNDEIVTEDTKVVVVKD